MASTTPLNFAPYSEPPDLNPAQTRWAPPPAAGPAPSSSSSASAPYEGYQGGASVSSLGAGTSFGNSYAGGGYANLGAQGPGGASNYEVTLWRNDYEAAGAYALGPFGAAVLLVFEIESDYVRFHAWQSILLNGGLVLLHLFFLLLFGRWMQYLLFAGDIVILGLMSLRAYHDADVLERHYLPLIGDLANAWVQT
ncbi:hypothetical protein DMC30DRAFT_399283, partial [Rhodotorula diobovata]